MNKSKIIPWKLYLWKSAIEAIVAMLLFSAIYVWHNVESIRSLAGDTAFSKMNSLVFSGMKTSTIKEKDLETPVVVYKIDKKYFIHENLLDEYNNTNYGNLFPRSKLAELIARIDALDKSQQPLAFFLDYDMENGSSSYDMNDEESYISADDMIFLKRLAEERHYHLLLPKTNIRNFVEEYAVRGKGSIAKKIASKINKGEILFVGVDFLGSDGITYRYNPMRKYENSDKIYYHYAVTSWQLRKNQDKEANQTVVRNNINDAFPEEIFLDEKKVRTEGAALFKSNILFKDNWNSNGSDLSERESKWQNLKHISAVSLLDEVLDFSPQTIVMLGVDFDNRDMHITSKGLLSGVLVHAEALKTILFIDGTLKHFNLAWGLIIIFIIFFMVSIFVRYFLASYPMWIQFPLELLLLSTILLACSSYILLEYQQWFNWFIPILIFYIDDLIIVLREYSGKNKKECEGEE